jgi:hypothetical protein
MISASPQEAFRAYSNDTAESAYTPDYAAEIDGEGDELAEEFFWFVQKNIPPSKMQIDWLVMREVIACAGQWGLTVRERERKNLAGQAWEMFGGVFTYLLTAKNVKACVYGIAFAFGLDQLNGKRSIAEVAREMKVTRALLSHYKRAAGDFFGIYITKFGKSQDAVEKYKQHGGSLKKPIKKLI